MPPTTPTPQDVLDRILASASDQVAAQQLSSSKQPELALLYASLSRLQRLLENTPADTNTVQRVKAQVDAVAEIQAGTKPFTDLGGSLANLYLLRQDVGVMAQAWLQAQQVTPRDSVQLDTVLLDTIARTRQLLSARPDVTAIMDDLTAVKTLRGGPADAVAYHDFHVLQLALKSVWLHAFDESLKSAVTQLYEQVVEKDLNTATAMPALDALNDIAALKDFLRGLQITSSTTSEPVPPQVLQAFPASNTIWGVLSSGQRFYVYLAALFVLNPDQPEDQKTPYRNQVAEIFKNPDGPGDRLSKAIFEIGRALNEPYAFDVFAPGTYNFGLLITYRQRWEPQEYQAGDLAATIPLAPGETRKFTKKRVIKESIAKKTIEKSSSLRSLQSSDTSRAESEIMTRTSTATNFKMTTNGSFNIGIGSFSTTSEFGGNNELFSSTNKKAFHEATIKAAEEYRLERSMEVDTSSSVETEETSSGEISNPNKEITVTYLFYELQRRFKISELLYRVRPVILIAQDVPAPHEIDEAWLIQYQWVLARVLLDESFRNALGYLTSGFAGDEVSVDVIRASWEKQRDLVAKLEALTQDQLATRAALRELIIQQTIKKDQLDNIVAGSFALGDALLKSLSEGDFRFQNMNNSSWSADDIEANRKAAETRLSYVEQALADAQDKLKQATTAFQVATKDYTAAMQNMYTRHIAIDQLRVHVKQNIIYYMQAIWAHEVPDQRYFRLYKQQVVCPATVNCGTTAVLSRRPIRGKTAVDFAKVCPPAGPVGVGGPMHDLSEVADIDNPLGYKGNYIVFPLIDDCPLTQYMLSEFMDEYLGVRDPDAVANFDAETFREEWDAAANDAARRTELRKELEDYLEATRRNTDEVIVPTGQLFIEALPGAHSLIEDFMLMHRVEDVLKVKGEVRHAELENLRLASRLVEGQAKPELLEDPDIERKIVVAGGVTVNP